MATLPSPLIVMESAEFAASHPAAAFYIRVELPTGVNQVDLPGCATLPAARAMAKTLGYEVAHWATYHGIVTRFHD